MTGSTGSLSPCLNVFTTHQTHFQEEEEALASQLLSAASSTFANDEEAEVLVAKCRALIESGAQVDAHKSGSAPAANPNAASAAQPSPNRRKGRRMSVFVPETGNNEDDTGEGERWTAMIYAAKNDNIRLIKLLLDKVRMRWELHSLQS